MIVVLAIDPRMRESLALPFQLYCNLVLQARVVAPSVLLSPSSFANQHLNAAAEILGLLLHLQLLTYQHLFYRIKVDCNV